MVVVSFFIELGLFMVESANDAEVARRLRRAPAAVLVRQLERYSVSCCEGRAAVEGVTEAGAGAVDLHHEGEGVARIAALLWLQLDQDPAIFGFHLLVG